jgi:uncharacterized protein
MNGEKDLSRLLKTMTPELNDGEYVFCTVADLPAIDGPEIIGSFKEKEGLTVIIEKQTADAHHLPYHFIAAWITLTVHSSLEAVGLTAAFSKALADEKISCNVIAAYYHDHIFVAKKEADKAMQVLRNLSVSF